MSKKTLLWLIAIVVAVAGCILYEEYTDGQKIVTDYFAIEVTPSDCGDEPTVNIGYPMRFSSHKKAYNELRKQHVESITHIIHELNDNIKNEKNPVLVGVHKKLLNEYSRKRVVMVSCTHKKRLNPNMILNELNKHGTDYDKMKEFCDENQISVKYEPISI